MTKQEIRQDMIDFMKQRNKKAVLTLRGVLAVIQNAEKQKQYSLRKKNKDISEADLEKHSKLTEQELIKIMFSEIKKRKDAISDFKKGKRDDLVVIEETEIKILRKYLPQQMDETEIKIRAEKVVKKLDANSIQDMGKVIKALMLELDGKAEGAVVANIVKKLLTQND